MRSIAVKAAKGEHRSQKLFTDLLEGVETEKVRREKFEFEEALQYLIEADAEVQRREKTGQSVADIIPHPDDMSINMETGKVTVIGPMTYTGKKRMLELLKTREKVMENIEETKVILDMKIDKKSKTAMKEYQKSLQSTVNKIDNHLQGWRPKE